MSNPEKLQDIPRYTLLLWLMFVGLIVFGFVVSWREGLIQLLTDGDQSRISIAIALVFMAGTLHCARRAIYLSSELEAAETTSTLIESSNDNGVTIDSGSLRLRSGAVLPECATTDYLRNLLDQRSSVANAASEGSRLEESFAESVKGSHDIGWFMVDVLIKLGLIGTIVGFIFMLGSVAETASLDVNTMQKVLRQMSAGMGTALFTTLAGLVCSILLGLQYLLLDKSADDLVLRTIRVGDMGLRVDSSQ